MPLPLNTILWTFLIAEVLHAIPIDLRLKSEIEPVVLQTDDSSDFCFQQYLPQLQAAADEWSKDYADCINNANNQRNSFAVQCSRDQKNINESSNAIVQYVQSCQAMTNDLEFFKCFSELSRNIVDITYIISSNATDDASFLTNIDSTMYICTNATQRTYVEKTANVFDDLQFCLLDGMNTSTIATAVNLELEATTTALETTTDFSETETLESDEDDKSETVASGEASTMSAEASTVAIMSV